MKLYDVKLRVQASDDMSADDVLDVAAEAVHNWTVLGVGTDSEVEDVTPKPPATYTIEITDERRRAGDGRNVSFWNDKALEVMRDQFAAWCSGAHAADVRRHVTIRRVSHT